MGTQEDNAAANDAGHDTRPVDPGDGGYRGFLEELRHRKVYHTFIIYVAAAWAIIQFADVVAPRLGMPDWSITFVIWALIVGFPFVMVLSWVFEIRSEGWPSLPSALEGFLRSARFVVLWIVGFVLFVVLAALYFGGLPNTSFALSPKDSVVVGEFQNFTTNTLLDESLGLAFRIGLEQSRYASVISNSQIRDTLAQMLQDPNSNVDRDLGIQVALREGARALIIGSVGGIGAAYKLSAEVIDPNDGRTVLVETATVTDIDSILGALDQLTRDLRTNLGESMEAVAESTVRLERVTTSNLDALKAYSLGIRAAGIGEVDDAIALFGRAIAMDPEFSMAHAKMATLYASALEANQLAREHRQLALQFKDRLTEHERLYIEASNTEDGSPAEMIQAWRLMRAMFPEDPVGHHNLATAYWRYENRFPEAAVNFSNAAAISNSWRHISIHNLGYVQLGLGEYANAVSNFEQAYNAQSYPIDAGLAHAYVVTRDYEAARQFLEDARLVPGEQLQFEVDQRWIAYYVDQGRFDEALSVIESTITRARVVHKQGPEFRAIAARLAILEAYPDKSAFLDTLRQQVATEMAQLETDSTDSDVSPVPHLLWLGKISARNGDSEPAQQILNRIRDRTEDSGFFFLEAYTTILTAEIALARGDADEALRLLHTAAVDRPLFQAHESLARAYEASGNRTAAIGEHEWILRHRGLPFAELMGESFGMEFSILDWAKANYHLGRLAADSGDANAAARHYRTFLDHWSQADPELPLIIAAQRGLAELDDRTDANLASASIY